MVTSNSSSISTLLYRTLWNRHLLTLIYISTLFMHIALVVDGRDRRFDTIAKETKKTVSVAMATSKEEGKSLSEPYQQGKATKSGKGKVSEAKTAPVPTLPTSSYHKVTGTGATKSGKGKAPAPTGPTSPYRKGKTKKSIKGKYSKGKPLSSDCNANPAKSLTIGFQTNPPTCPDLVSLEKDIYNNLENAYLNAPCKVNFKCVATCSQLTDAKKTSRNLQGNTLLIAIEAASSVPLPDLDTISFKATKDAVNQFCKDCIISPITQQPSTPSSPISSPLFSPSKQPSTGVSPSLSPANWPSTNPAPSHSVNPSNKPSTSASPSSYPSKQPSTKPSEPEDHSSLCTPKSWKYNSCCQDCGGVFDTKQSLVDALSAYVSNSTEGIRSFGLINCWDTSQITNMDSLFKDNSSFNDEIGCWNTSNVISMNETFFGASSFNQALASWNVSKVEYMNSMFSDIDLGLGTSFNQPLDEWDVSKCTDMTYMFWGASSFNQPLADWNVSSVGSMYAMFQYAASFNQNLCQWYDTLNTDTDVTDMLMDSGCSNTNGPDFVDNAYFCLSC